jgi:erythromycin esterase
MRLRLSILATLLLTATGWAQQPERIDKQVVEWINTNAYPLATTDPDAAIDDLAPLEAIVGPAKVVGLGEATHGSHELWTVRHRIVRYLVERTGFTGFVLEAPWPVGPQLDSYVLHGTGNLAAILAAAWPFDSREMVDLFTWMRAYNADPRHANKVRVAAMDISSLAPEMFDRVTRYVKATAPDLLRQVRQAYAPLRGPALDKDHPVGFFPKAYDSLPAATKTKYMRQAEQVENALRRHESALVARSSRRSFDSALDSAQVISQFMRFGALLATDSPAGFREHERSMAANVAWWHDHVGKTIVWAHDAHVARHTMLPKVYPDSMTGTFLRERYGDQYVSIGTSFGQGAYTAMGTDPNAAPARGSASPIITITLGAPAPNSSNAVLNQREGIGYILDLRAAPAEVRAWLEQPRPFQIGLASAVDDPKWLAENTAPSGALAAWFDVLVHLREVRASHPSSWTVR